MMLHRRAVSLSGEILYKPRSGAMKGARALAPKPAKNGSADIGSAIVLPKPARGAPKAREEGIRDMLDGSGVVGLCSLYHVYVGACDCTDQPPDLRVRFVPTN